MLTAPRPWAEPLLTSQGGRERDVQWGQLKCPKGILGLEAGTHTKPGNQFGYQSIKINKHFPAPSMYKGLSQNIWAGRDLGAISTLQMKTGSICGRDRKFTVAKWAPIFQVISSNCEVEFCHFNFWMRKLKLEFPELVEGSPAYQHHHQGLQEASLSLWLLLFLFLF